MDFIHHLTEIITNNDNIKNKHIYPLQLLIFEYTLSICFDCDMLLKKEYKCKKCNIIRCKFHCFVNDNINYCTECQIGIRYASDKKLYLCIKCGNEAYYGYINDVILCSACFYNNKEHHNMIFLENIVIMVLNVMD